MGAPIDGVCVSGVLVKDRSRGQMYYHRFLGKDSSVHLCPCQLLPLESSALPISASFLHWLLWLSLLRIWAPLQTRLRSRDKCSITADRTHSLLYQSG